MIYFALYINMSELSQKISEKLDLIYEEMHRVSKLMK